MKAKTFASLYEVSLQKDKNKTETIKVDRQILQRLLLAREGGRNVDMAAVLKHELMSIPSSLVSTKTSLNDGDKSQLIDVILKDASVRKISALPPMPEESTSALVIDAQDLIHRIGRPSTASNFGDYANAFCNKVTHMLQYERSTRVDIVFDHYKLLSIKNGTRSKRRAPSARPVRRPIYDKTTPLPKNWQNFMSDIENKSQLSAFLSRSVIAHFGNSSDVSVVVGVDFQTLSRSRAQILTLILAVLKQTMRKLTLGSYCIA
jgi:hypothetical protein